MDLPKHYRYEREYPYEEGSVRIILLTFDAIRETQGGYWIIDGLLGERFVLKQSNKRYAYPTKEEAFNSFRIRTIRSLGHNRRNFNNSLKFVELVNNHELSIKPYKTHYKLIL